MRPPKPSAMLSALAASPRIIMRVASVTSAGWPAACATYGSATRTASAANGAIQPRSFMWRFSSMGGKQSLRPHEQHDRHDEIDAHGGDARRERVGLRIVHHQAHDLRQ